MKHSQGKVRRIVRAGSEQRPAGAEAQPVVRKIPKALQRSEHDEQRDLFAWAVLESRRHPVLSLMFAVPNGGDRHPAVAAKLKAEGVKSGVPDVVLPHPSGRYHGLFVEMKRVGASPSDTSTAQHSWHEALAAQGYAVRVCRGFEQARAAILDYLNLTTP